MSLTTQEQRDRLLTALEILTDAVDPEPHDQPPLEDWARRPVFNARALIAECRAGEEPEECSRCSEDISEGYSWRLCVACAEPYLNVEEP